MIIPIVPPKTKLQSECLQLDNSSSYHRQSNENVEVPEWTLIELNGELHLPYELDTIIEDHQTQKGQQSDDVQHSINLKKKSKNESIEKNINLELGSIQYKKEGTPTMIIGSHELRGKIETLKQPFVVLKKRIYGNDANDYDSMDNEKEPLEKKRKTNPSDVKNELCNKPNSTKDKDNTSFQLRKGDSNNCVDNVKVSYEIAGIISKRLLFNSYPKSILR